MSSGRRETVDVKSGKGIVVWLTGNGIEQDMRAWKLVWQKMDVFRSLEKEEVIIGNQQWLTENKQRTIAGLEEDICYWEKIGP